MNTQRQCNPFHSLDLNRGQQLDFCYGFCCRSLIMVKSKWSNFSQKSNFSQNFAYSLWKNVSVSWEQYVYVVATHLYKYYDIWQSIFTHTTSILEIFTFAGKDTKKNGSSFFLQNSPSVVNTVLSISVSCWSYTKLLAWIQMNSSSWTLAWLCSLLRVSGTQAYCLCSNQQEVKGGNRNLSPQHLFFLMLRNQANT